MSWMDRISHANKDEHPMLNQRDESSKNALAVMANAGALFEVHYPAARWHDEDGLSPIPMVESGAVSYTHLTQPTICSV